MYTYIVYIYVFTYAYICIHICPTTLVICEMPLTCGLLDVWSGYAAESMRLFDIGVRLLRMDTIIRETANDPSTIGRAYSVTVLLGTICQNWGRQSNEVKKKSKGEMVTWALLPDPDTLYRAVKNVKIQFPLRSDQLHMP